MSRLLIVSETPYYRDAEGQLAGWSATVREIDHLATLFSTIEHVAPLYPGLPPASVQRHQGPIDVVPLVPAGGSGLRAKLGLLRRVPTYCRIIWQALGRADVVHVRAPANVSLLALLLLTLRRRPPARWFKFAGNWRPRRQESSPGEARSYALQRWWLERGWAGRGGQARVTVNGRWPDQPRHVLSFDNPSVRRQELETARAEAANKRLTSPARLLFVGLTSAAKGLDTALRAAAKVHEGERAILFDVVGDGPERQELEALAAELGLEQIVTFHGWTARDQLGEHYRRAHLLLLPSRSEGWPKVISEAMAHGVVPLASSVSCIPQMLSDIGSGRALPVAAVDRYVAAIVDYLERPQAWRQESQAAIAAADRFTYEHYLERLRQLPLGLA